MTAVDDALAKAEELLGTLNARREELERLAAAEDVDGDAAVDLIGELAESGRNGDRGRADPRAHPGRCGRLTSSAKPSRHTSAPCPSHPSSATSTRHSATRSSRAASACGPFCASRSRRPPAGSVEAALPAAAALELVHTFSLVHDDLPSMDDDAVRRGRPSAHVAFGEGVALLAGDALLAEALRSLPWRTNRTRSPGDLVAATLGMIGGKDRDVTGDDTDLDGLHRLKTGRLFVAAVRMGLDVAGIPESERAVWLALG